MHPTKLNTSFELLNSLFFDIDLAIFNAALYNLSFVFNSFFTSFSFVIKLYWKHLLEAQTMHGVHSKA